MPARNAAAMLADPDKQVMERAYARWAPIYDAVCGPLFLPARRAATAAARRVGGRILEVGVGTGLSFAGYDLTMEVVGIDFSDAMIAKARARLATGRYPFITSLAVMDAHDLAFPDASFDCVVAQFFITLVENADRALCECARVARPAAKSSL
jgi:phosphatidylethanolamine/phosphatidyl-N-methylethanolamine N-methyltransferase